MIDPRPIRESARIAGEQQADAIIVTGTATGNAPTTEDLREAANGSDLPVLIGSGLDAENARTLLLASDGAIVGTALMHDRAVDPAAVNSLMSKLDRPKR